MQFYQEHVSSLFCSLLIYLFFMEAKLGLAVLGKLIPRDLASCPKLFFFLKSCYSDGVGQIEGTTPLFISVFPEVKRQNCERLMV